MGIELIQQGADGHFIAVFIVIVICIHQRNLNDLDIRICFHDCIQDAHVVHEVADTCVNDSVYDCIIHTNVFRITEIIAQFFTDIFFCNDIEFITQLEDQLLQFCRQFGNGLLQAEEHNRSGLAVITNCLQDLIEHEGAEIGVADCQGNDICFLHSMLNIISHDRSTVFNNIRSIIAYRVFTSHSLYNLIIGLGHLHQEGFSQPCGITLRAVPLSDILCRTDLGCSSTKTVIFAAQGIPGTVVTIIKGCKPRFFIPRIFINLVFNAVIVIISCHIRSSVGYTDGFLGEVEVQQPMQVLSTGSAHCQLIMLNNDIFTFKLLTEVQALTYLSLTAYCVKFCVSIACQPCSKLVGVGVIAIVKCAIISVVASQAIAVGHGITEGNIVDGFLGRLRLTGHFIGGFLRKCNHRAHANDHAQSQNQRKTSLPNVLHSSFTFLSKKCIFIRVPAPKSCAYDAGRARQKQACLLDTKRS